MAKKIVETPLMKQYAEMKQKHPDAILLFRVGDFYETFSDDAIAASENSAFKNKQTLKKKKDAAFPTPDSKY